MVKNLKIFNLALFTGLCLGEIVLSGSLNSSQNVSLTPLPIPPMPVIEEKVEDKEIQTIPCLYFDSPVESFKIGVTDEQVVIGYQNECEIYGYKYKILQEKTTQCVIDDCKMIGVEIVNDQGQAEVKYCSAYTDVEDNSLVIFPNGVITQTIVETVQSEYETAEGTSTIEAPVYQNTLSFTTNEEVTNILVDFEVTDNGMHPVEDIRAYIPAR